jgi:uncharacterized protein (TIGR00730 family)
MFRSIRQFRMLLRIAWDYVKGVSTFTCTGRCVTVFGSARLDSRSALYELARSFGGALGRAGYTVMTGGGPGLMEAANRGAQEAGARSLGCHLRFPFDESPNGYMDGCVRFRYFLTRKLMLVRYSCAFVIFPGGLGTLDEFFELLTLIKSKKLPSVPIVMIGTSYWKPLLSLFDAMAAARTIDASEIDFLFLTDDIREAIAHIKSFTVSTPGHEIRTLDAKVAS